MSRRRRGLGVDLVRISVAWRAPSLNVATRAPRRHGVHVRDGRCPRDTRCRPGVDAPGGSPWDRRRHGRCRSAATHDRRDGGGRVVAAPPQVTGAEVTTAAPVLGPPDRRQRVGRVTTRLRRAPAPRALSPGGARCPPPRLLLMGRPPARRLRSGGWRPSESLMSRAYPSSATALHVPMLPVEERKQ